MFLKALFDVALNSQYYRSKQLTAKAIIYYYYLLLFVLQISLTIIGFWGSRYAKSIGAATHTRLSRGKFAVVIFTRINFTKVTCAYT